MTYGHLQADSLYTGISSGPNARYRVWEAFAFALPSLFIINAPITDEHTGITEVNKAIADYTSPALCTSVTPFPPIGDAAYRQRAGG